MSDSVASTAPSPAGSETGPAFDLDGAGPLAVADPEAPRRVPDPIEELPSWLVVGLVAAIVWCASAGALGVVLLALGWYAPGVVIGAATVAAVVTGIAAQRGLGARGRGRGRVDHRAALGAVGLVLVFFAFAGAFHSEHLLTDRDPALYISWGRSIADTHELTPRIPEGPFKDPAFGNQGDRYGVPFFPMLAVLLALGWSIGGELGMLLVGPVLGALGLLAAYALATRVLGPRRGLLALAVLVIVPLQLWFARDAYSELVVQVVVLGGLWLYLEARTKRRWGLGAVSGALVASAALARVDALAIVACCLVVVAAEWVRTDADEFPIAARRVVAAFGGALVVATAVALGVTRHVAAGYIWSLGDEYHPLVAALAAAAIGTVAVIVVHRRRPGIGGWFAARNPLFGAAVAAGVALTVWAYVWRPAPKHALPIVTRYPIGVALRSAVNNWYFTHSLHWFSAYIGVVGIAVAGAGLVILANRARRGAGAAATVFLVATPIALLYIARPSISPDQPWAMRRFLPVVVPGIAIAIAIAFESCWRVARSQRIPGLRALAVVATAGVFVAFAVPTVSAAVPMVQARVQHGAVRAVDDICRVVGDDGAVLVYGHAFLDVELPTPIHAFCGVPVGYSSTVDMQHLADQWHALGRRLFVATAAPETVRHVVPAARIVGHDVIADDHDPEKSFNRAPKHSAPSPADIWILEIPPRSG